MNKNVTFESLSRSAKELSAMVIMGSADFIFKLWPDGEIAHAAFGDTVQSATDAAGLRNRSIQDIVLPEYGSDLSNLIHDTCRGDSKRHLKVLHSDLIGHGSAARYTAHLSGDGRNVMLIGKSMSSQLTMAEHAADAEIARYRDAGLRLSEVRYRHIFSASSEGLLTLDEFGQVEEVNHIAAHLLSQQPEDVVGTAVTQYFTDSDGVPVQVFPDDTKAETNISNQVVTVRRTETQVKLSCHAVRSLQRVLYVVRINPIDPPDTNVTRDARSHTVELLGKTSVPVLLTDKSGCVTWANDAFASLLPGRTVLQQNVSDLLGVSPGALEAVMGKADENGRIVTSLSAMDGALDLGGDAHLWWVSVPSQNPVGYGILIRFATAREDAASDPDLAPEYSALADLVGQAPMKKLVRRSTELLERNCIEAALRLTGNNRAAAASVLGLSRQSLYLKLHQHDLL